jgi:hypothetical protein
MHPDAGSNRHPPDVISHTTTEHFGQATGAINEPTASFDCDVSMGVSRNAPAGYFFSG